MLNLSDFYSWEIVFIAIDIQIIAGLIPYFLIKNHPDLKEDFKKFKYSEISVVIIYFLSFIVSLAFEEPLIFSISSLLTIMVNIFIIAMMVYHFQKRKSNTIK